MNRIEILAPCGGFDSITAAVRSGADAVYVGGRLFSARASAQNFDSDELKKAVAYCHIHNVKVYLTINTIVFDDEFENLKAQIISAAKADIDAVIVQNMGVARLVKELVPDMKLHASTQMSVHTASGVRALYEMGFSRVVLAREMSRDEIAKAAEIPVELEVFVHGALCMSMSGQCYFSAMLGSRSGNRGACAQTCRLPFSVGCQKDGHALSLKDNSLIQYINDLQKLGVTSAKIEGRMKRPEYVSAAVRACKEQRDNGFVSEESANALRGVFSRTGFTDGYYKAKRDRSMFGTRTKEDVVSADEQLLATIRRSYKDEIRNVEIDGSFCAELGKSPILTVTDGLHTVTQTADIVCERAIKSALDVDRCKAQLSKTGGTAYHFNRLEIFIEDGISLPMSALNMLRRDALKRLDSLRSVVHNYTINNIDIPKFDKYIPDSKRETRIRVTDTNLSPAFKESKLVFVPLFSEQNELRRLLDEGYKIGAEIPRGMFGMDEKIAEQLKQVKSLGITDVLCNNIGALYLAKKAGMTMHGGFGLNLVNTYDLLWAQEY